MLERWSPFVCPAWSSQVKRQAAATPLSTLTTSFTAAQAGCSAWWLYPLMYLSLDKDLRSVLPMALTNNVKISPCLFQRWKDTDNTAQVLPNFTELSLPCCFSALFLRLQTTWERWVALATSQHSAWTEITCQSLRKWWNGWVWGFLLLKQGFSSPFPS